ncbi:hypothetical protein AURDEDRAFT_162193 [Auricularia subglabra TFB-10046 SS5]|nr:hypothetical protein AURDEDRAFT_162193 [Auricularia subglabra TFB-10046 SS5]
MKVLALTNLSGEPHVSLKPDHNLVQLELEPRDHLGRYLRHTLSALPHEGVSFIAVTTINRDTLAFVIESLSDATVVSFGLCDPDAWWRYKRQTAVRLSSWSSSRVREFPVVSQHTLFNAFSNTGRFSAVTTFNVAHHLLHLAPSLLPSVTRLLVDFPSEDTEMYYDNLAFWLEPARSPKLDALVLNGEQKVGSGLHHVSHTSLRRRMLNAGRLAECITTRPPPLRELMLRVHMEETPETVVSLLAPTAIAFSWFLPGEEIGMCVVQNLARMSADLILVSAHASTRALNPQNAQSLSDV